MSNKLSWSAGFPTVNESRDFVVLLNPNYSPFEKDIFGYYLVYKPFGTVEACANSIVVINSFLEEAQMAYDAMVSKQKKDAELANAGIRRNDDENTVH